MAIMAREAPNWLLRGLIALSVGLHILILAKMSGIGSHKTTEYIELEIRAEEKPVARNIPSPERRRVAETRTEAATAAASKTMAAPAVVSPPDEMLRPSRTTAPRLFDWTPEMAVEEETPPSYGTEAKGEAEDISGKLLENYYRLVLEKIEENRKYPYAARKMNAEGKAVVLFVIETTGAARDVAIAESSGNRLLDKAALAAVKSSSPFPEPPPEAFDEAVSLEVGVVFQLNK